MSIKPWVLSFVLISILIIIPLTAHQAAAALTDSTDLAVLKDAPTGIGINSYMSNAAPTVPDKKDIYTTNSAQIVDRTGANSSSGGNIVSLASGKNTYGSIWSTDKSFDINKKQTISAWLYFGPGNGSQDVNSEGISFVLQNDSKGVGALGAGLEGMGVYGYDASQINIFSGYAPDQSYIQKTAVQNSIALEFDSANNSFYTPSAPINNNGITFPPTIAQINKGTSYYSLDGYDTQLGTPTSNLTKLGFPSTSRYGASGNYGHIALTYPGLADSYQKTDLTASTIMKNAYNPFTDGFVLVHDSSQPAYLIDGNNDFYWHHVTINWTPAASGSTNATLSYSFNDKNSDYSDNTSTDSIIKNMSKSISVDTSKLNTTDGKVRWGFTAANGPSTNVASKLVAFDSIPDLLYADADANIVDTSLNNKKITADSTDKNVASGDSLNLNYDLNYISGNEDWKAIAAKIKIPDNVTVTPDADGNVAYITYGDGTKEAITSSEITANSLQHTLAKTIGSTASSAGSSAKITISAKDNTVTTDTSVAKAVATFTGSNEITTTNTPDFTILAPKKYTLNLTNTATNSDIELLYKEDTATLNLPTSLSYSDTDHSFGDTDTNTNIIYKITVGNKTYTVGANATGTSYTENLELRSIIDNDTDFWNIFTLNSANTVKVTAIDQTNGLVSNTITYNVNTKQNKSLNLTVSNNLQFKDINYGDTTEYLKRQSGFDLSVTSLKEPWQLSVSTNGLYLDGKTLNNNMALVYKKDAASNYSTLNGTPTPIEQDTVSRDDSYTDNISGDWTNNTGILLKQLGSSEAGQYTGTLTWTVADSVNN